MSKHVYQTWALWVCVGVAACTAAESFAAGPFYVVPGGTGTAGTSWADAFGSIQNAVTAASTAGGGEVWVKGGKYTSTTLDPVVTMASGVSLYGGFAGTETSRDARDWKTNVTTITGDSNGDGVGDRRCVVGANSAILDGFTLTKGHSTASGGAMLSQATSATVVNCTFTGNSAAGNGGAVSIVDSSQPSFTNCTFTGNSASYGGAIMINEASMTPVLTNCLFTSNTAAGYGGAVFNSGAALATAFMNCTFTGNSAPHGGALYNDTAATPTLTNCILWNDSSELEGNLSFTVTYSCVQGGFSGTGNLSADPLLASPASNDYELQLSSPCLDTGTATGAPAVDIRGVARPVGTGIDMGAYEGCIAVRYVKVGGTGDGTSWATACGSIQNAVNALSAGEVWVAAGTYAVTASPGVTMKNHVAIYGGFVGTETVRGARDSANNPTIIDGGHAYQCVTGASYAAFDGFTVQNGQSSSSAGAGMNNVGCSLLVVVNCTFAGNYVSGNNGGAMQISSSSLTLTNCVFSANYNSECGGALYSHNSSPTLANCSFIGNTASYSGGAVYVHGWNPQFVNCTFDANSAESGSGAFEASGGAPALTNCVFTRNVGFDAGAISRTYGSSAMVVTNCSFTANAGDRAGAVYVAEGAITIRNSIFWGDSYPEFLNNYDVPGTLTIEHSCASGLSGSGGNFSLDPLFVDGADGGNGFDLRLQATSPCINTGEDTSGTTPGSAKDKNGVARPQGPAYDLGAYEYAALSTVAFSATPTSGVVPLTVTFTDASTSSLSPITGWTWDFGDGGTSTEQNPEHTFTTAGFYDVSLTARAAYGSGSVTKLRYITVNRGVPTVTEWPTLSGLTYGHLLYDSLLTGGVASVPGTFSLPDTSITPSAGTFYATVVFTPADPSSYDSVYGTVPLQVTQGVPEIMRWPTCDDLVYGQSLLDTSLHGGQSADIGGDYAFAEPHFRPDAGVYSASVIFTPMDGVDYTPVSGTVDVNVAQALPVITTPPVATPITFGQRLVSSLLLHGQATAGSTVVAGTFAFADPAVMPDASGPYPAAITFTPADTVNYLPATGTVSVAVEAADCPQCTETTGPYDEGTSACLIVPGTFPAGTSFAWSRQDGTPLDGARFKGIFCRCLQITQLQASDAGTYLCTYDDGSTVNVYTVVVVVNRPREVPTMPNGGRLVAAIALMCLAMTWRYRRTLRA